MRVVSPSSRCNFSVGLPVSSENDLSESRRVLLPEGQVSRWHCVTSDEVWHLYEGGPLELFELSESGHTLSRHSLGPVGREQTPVHTIPSGSWQAARSLTSHALVGCTVSPGFDFADFRLLADDPARAADLRTRWPESAQLL